MFKDLNKKQFISLIFLTVVISGIIGWAYEVAFYYINGGMDKIYLRGGNFLPFINIYAYGALLIMFFTHKHVKSPLKVFLLCVLVTGLLEYFSGYILYGVLGWNKGWDYNTEIWNFGNINGYVCLRSVLVFGLSGLLLMYVIVPLLIKLVKSKYKNVIFVICIILFTLFIGDEVYNLIIAKLFNLPNAIDVYKNLGFNYM